MSRRRGRREGDLLHYLVRDETNVGYPWVMEIRCVGEGHLEVKGREGNRRELKGREGK